MGGRLKIQFLGPEEGFTFFATLKTQARGINTIHGLEFFEVGLCIFCISCLTFEKLAFR